MARLTISVLGLLAVAAGARDDDEAARRWGEESLKLYGSLNHQYGMGMAHHHLGNILRAARDFEGALTHYQCSLGIGLGREDAVSVALVLEDFSLLLAGQGQWLRAAALLGAATLFLEDAHACLTPNELDQQRQVLSECCALTMEQAVQLAQDETLQAG